MQGIRNWTNAEAAEKVAHDRETHQRDLFESIERGDFPKWKFSVQIMPESDVGKDPEARLELVRNVDGLTGDPANAPPIETPLAIPTLVQRSAPG